MDANKKITNILNTIKLKVEDEARFKNDVDTVLSLFDTLKEVDLKDVSTNLNKKEIKINDLREDIAIDAKFREDLRGKYFKSPNVSKKI